MKLFKMDGFIVIDGILTIILFNIILSASIQSVKKIVTTKKSSAKKVIVNSDSQVSLFIDTQEYFIDEEKQILPNLKRAKNISVVFLNGKKIICSKNGEKDKNTNRIILNIYNGTCKALQAPS